MEDQNEFEIDLWELLRFLKKKAGIILSVTLLCGVIGWVVSSFLLRPQYTASTRAYILTRTNESSIVYADIQISTYMLYDYQELISGQNVTKEVIKRLGLDMTDAELSNRITVNSESNTRILQIDITHEDPQTAADIANCVREVASAQIREFMEVDAVKTVYEADVPEKPSSPNVQRNTLVAALVGMLAAAGVFSVMFMLDDTIRTEEDVERYLGLSILGVIPESEELSTAKGAAAKVRGRTARSKKRIRK